MRAAAAAAVSFLAIFSLAVASEVQWTKEYQVRIGAHSIEPRQIPNLHVPR